MSRPKSDPWYRSIAFDLWGTNERLSAAAVTREIEQGALRAKRDDAPSHRTVGRWRTEFRQLSDAQRREYGVARWPDAMESGALPWEASAAGPQLARGGFGLPLPRRLACAVPQWRFRSARVGEGRRSPKPRGRVRTPEDDHHLPKMLISGSDHLRA